MERTIENVQKHIDLGYSLRKLGNTFGCSPTAMTKWLKRKGLQTQYQSGEKDRRKWCDADLKKAVSESKTISGVLRILGLSIRPGNYGTVHRHIERLGLDLDHFTGLAETNGNASRLPLSAVLVENSNYSRSTLKERLLKEGLLVNKCALCGNEGEWRANPLTMVLDHINGVNNDNRLENLRMLCPNCNSQQDTFCGKNKRKKPTRLCSKCQKPIHKNNISGICKSCGPTRLGARKVKNRPNKEILLAEIEELGYEGTGRKYGVTGNAIRKWLK